MTSLDVRIVRLEPMRVASVWGFGQEPEMLAHRKLEAWAGPKGYLDDLAHHRVFGFNNPNPSPATPNYGYVLWMQVGPDEPPEADTRIESFDGGLYAVTRVIEHGDPGVVIPATWQRLHAWCEDSPHRFGRHQWLEEHLPAAGNTTVDTPAGRWVLDLYMPIIER